MYQLWPTFLILKSVLHPSDFDHSNLVRIFMTTLIQLSIYAPVKQSKKNVTIILFATYDTCLSWGSFQFIRKVPGT